MRLARGPSGGFAYTNIRGRSAVVYGMASRLRDGEVRVAELDVALDAHDAVAHL